MLCSARRWRQSIAPRRGARTRDAVTCAVDTVAALQRLTFVYQIIDTTRRAIGHERECCGTGRYQTVRGVERDHTVIDWAKGESKPTGIHAFADGEYWFEK
jgi:hypothetical protein